MTLPTGRLRQLLLPMAASTSRSAAARELAQHLGAASVEMYVKDPALDVMLPAPGMPKTVPGGPKWREFLRRCMKESRPAGDVDRPPPALLHAQGIARQGAALIVLGAPLAGEVIDELENEFPLLAALLQAEQALQVERAEAAEAREAASRSRTLAQALDAARASAAELNLQLRREHERKDEFLAMLAHELRNPLSPLVNSIEILRRSGAGRDGGIARQLDVMGRQLKQLTHLVDDLLDVSRVSRGVIELRRETLDLDALLADAVESVRPLIDARRHVLQRTASTQPVYVYADRVRLTQVFANLLTNAAKYTDPGGRLSCSVVTDQRRVSVVVQDTGIGIPQNMLSQIFDMFAQVPSALGRAQGGLGIGLTLTRQLVELHGGRVSAYSRGEGLGSTFTVSLPQVLAPRLAPPDQAPVATALPASVAPPRVLVVDDNRDGAETMAAVLEGMGAQTRVAHDGEEALRVAPEFRPHLVLLDIGLPGADGYEIARRMRLVEGWHGKLVALTGYGSGQDKQRALDAGFDEHQVKPLPPETAQRLLAGVAAMQARS